MYLLDTNVVSEARRGSAEAIAWMKSANPTQVYLSVLTLGEIRRGMIMKGRSDRRAADALHHWLQRLRQDFHENILSVTDRITLEWGRIAAMRTRGAIDGLIAATAISHGFALVTRNAQDFDDLDLSVINPWATAT
jgi:predicted nucleic acid-binding protein